MKFIFQIVFMLNLLINISIFSVQYWIKENGQGAYCVGDLPDGAYSAQTCVIVSIRPSAYHVWNVATSSWVESLELKIKYFKVLRDTELLRTDKYVLQDYFALFSKNDQKLIIEYRQQLRDWFNDNKFCNKTWPICPTCILPN